MALALFGTRRERVVGRRYADLYAPLPLRIFHGTPSLLGLRLIYTTHGHTDIPDGLFR